MKKVRAFFFSLHRIAGTIISLFFFMWFISGLVLIYHSFPNVDQIQIYEKRDALPSSLPGIHTILAQLPESDNKVRNIKVRNFQGQSLFSIKTKDSLYTICGDTIQSIKPVTQATIDNIVKKWVDAPIIKVDTLNERDIWIMYSRYEKEMPIYKFYFNDEEKHQLYISSRTGEVQQFTNCEQRFWAWVGAIPHKFYVPALRKNTDTWILSLTIGGIIALITAISGIYTGVYVLCKRYKKKRKIGTPYKKYWYKWHHILGLILGSFLITFAFSGAMALQRIPQWVIKTHGDYRVTDSQLRGKPLAIDAYILDYRAIISEYGDVKTIEWSYFQDIPIYNIVRGNKEVSINASTPNIKELYLSQSQIEKAICRVHKDNGTLTLSLINEYEEYYMSRENNLPLPVYKVEIDNADNSLYYINPKTGDFKYLNQNRKAKKWVFSGLHYLNIKWLVEHPVLWTIAIWILCIGGSFISLSGVCLGIKYIRRKIRSFGYKLRKTRSWKYRKKRQGLN